MGILTGIARLLLTLALATTLAAVWAPGEWWKWLLTAILFLIVAAAVSDARDEVGRRAYRRGTARSTHVHTASCHGPIGELQCRDLW